MNNSILYYPTIEFQKSDYRWLWNASLFWDKIYRIVPPGYSLNEPRNIEALCSTGEIGIPISPIRYSKRASEEFSNFMLNNQRNAAALSMIDEAETEYIRIHSSKIDVKLQREIFYRLKKIDEDENWLYANPNTVNFYMTFLANHIAKKNSLSLYTPNQELWTTSTYFLYDGKMQEMYMPGENFVEPSKDALVSIMIPDIFPQNVLDISPENILKFRERRKDERQQFISAVNHFREEINKADAPEVVEVIMNEEKKKIDFALNEYKKSMDLLKTVKFGGVLTTAITIAADALGYANNVPELYKNIFESTGVWAGVLTGIAEKKLNNKKNPYTYLAHLDSEFSLFHNSRDIFASSPFWASYNYTLYRSIEEFIND
ncbi:MAG: hypothetical protein IJD45_01630 [Clostridia bacterium]|nr:hypothetical protein [Clostridia bacterium]